MSFKNVLNHGTNPVPAIELQELTKDYGEFRAVDHLSIDVERGEIFGFLGPNGAGKTTTIQLLMGMLKPTSGACFINDLNCEDDRVAVKREVGYLPDNPSFHDYLTGYDILGFVGSMHGLEDRILEERMHQLFHELDLQNDSHEFAVNYSSGMKKKLALACARVHEPSVYILDEPMRGLDPNASRDIQNWIRRRAERGETIFLSTHILERAQNLCSRVAIINEGRLLKEGPSEDVRQLLTPGGTLQEVFIQLTDDASDR